MTRNHVRRQVSLSAAALHVATASVETELPFWEEEIPCSAPIGFGKREYFARYSAADRYED